MGEIKNTFDKLADTVGGAAGKMKASGTTHADTFVAEAAIGNLYEIAASSIALTRSASPELQAFARRMIEDHTTATHQMESALETNETRGVAAPEKGLDARRQSMVKHLKEAPDDAFDETFLDQQVLAHEETVSLMRSYRDEGDNPQLRSVAAGALPVFHRHLDHVKQLRRALA